MSEGGDAPRVSVVIPCHNSAAFVRETAEAVFAQSLRALEILFVDDGSSDDTAEVVSRVIADHPGRRARLLALDDRGLAASRNLAVSAARGAYILPLDADDLIAPTMLEECADLLDAEPGIAFVYTDREDFGDVERRWSAGQYSIERLKYFNQLAYCALYRRSMWEAIGGYRVNVSGLDDWDFWVAAASHGFAARHIAKPHLKHRTRAGSLMWRLLGEYERLHAQIVLNNREAYDESEVTQASRFLATGEPASFLRAARAIFMRAHQASTARQR